MSISRWDAETAGYAKKTAGLSSAEKSAAIQKLTGKAYDAKSYAESGGYSQQRVPSIHQQYLQSLKNPYAYSGRGGAEKKLQDEDALMSAAYEDALKGGLFERGSLTDAESKQAGYIDPHGQWVSRTNRLTGERETVAERVHKITSGNAGLKGNWNRNQAAWQAGIGAALGFVTGGPVGAITGGVAGYASGKPSQDANRADRKSKYHGMTPEKLKRLMDIARSRASGAGTFNYTQQVEV